MRIPFHVPSIGEDEISEVVATLRSGWLTTGPRTKQFEGDFARYVGAKHAIALNSATAALHLALEAIGLGQGHAVLVPTMTFAATAEVVRYFDATPVLVDCREDDFNLDVEDARRQARRALDQGLELKAIIPVHYAGQVADIAGVKAVAAEFGLRIIEDAAHCCPALYREQAEAPWKSVGSEGDVTCFSFYANKCITTGEGGMACTNDDALAERIRIMSLHGISRDAWKRFTSEGSWYYEIIAPGFKYNLTDVASAIGIHQLRRADRMREERELVARWYQVHLEPMAEITLPVAKPDRVHSWHLFVIRLRSGVLAIDRAQVIQELKAAGVGTSVHWMPLHMHPYYRDKYGYRPEQLPISAKLFEEIVSLPIYPGMTEASVRTVCYALKEIIVRNRKGGR
ncbi:MAG: DegT/DnrJ/EryC1/StrS aminotransferase family protein [Opitutaceae bacterium]